MRNVLTRLAELQEVDLKLDRLRRSREQVPARIRQLEEELARETAQLAASEEKLRTLETQKGEAERGVVEDTARLKQAEHRLISIKTMREYQAAKRELDLAKKAVTLREEEIARLSAQIAELRAETDGRRETLAARRAAAEREIGELREELARVEAQLAVETQARQRLVQGLDADLLRRYDTIRSRRQGLAVVEARQGACSGCRMAIPPQIYNEVQRNGDLVACPNCQRILYFVREQPA
ncbi:MAG TPA: C4-type zinc ribbon domain-containing protein [Thermodesulfobacteriota bacterium]|nr:C4-type zinc ribbon domain-containing protein [Thermodesulfobacteriota bacterium]